MASSKSHGFLIEVEQTQSDFDRLPDSLVVSWLVHQDTGRTTRYEQERISLSLEARLLEVLESCIPNSVCPLSHLDRNEPDF
jgi:hypothetical protein